MAARRLTLMFLAVMLPPAFTLIWLGSRLLKQDEILQAQHEIEAREASAEIIIRSLTQSVAEAERWSRGGAVPEGAVRILLRPQQHLETYPRGRLLWSPAPVNLPEAANRIFVDGERAEFQGALQSAAVSYTELARSSDPSVRAGALMRLARVERKQGRIDAALEAYHRLATIRGITIDGTPADFLARRAICGLLEAGGKQELQQHVRSLEADFLAGQWTLSRAVWELAASEIQRWTGRALVVSVDQQALSVAVEWLWQVSRDHHPLPSGRRSLVLEGMPVTLFWHTQPSQDAGLQVEAIAIGPTVLDVWMQKASQNGRTKIERLSLLSESGESLAGEQPDSNSRPVSRTSIETGLPWTLVLSPTSESSEAANLTGRRRLLAAGLVAIVLLLAGGSYFLWRVMARELAVARLQTDFVAAVSHEFRTPLTSLRHVTELLQEDDGLPPGREQDRRTAFYAVLGRNTERLHRLVESLLDFSRMETGRKPWNMQSIDAGVLAEGVAAEFQKEMEARGVRINFATDSSGPFHLRADAAALGHALWNLLDNAVKYSPEQRPIHVSVKRHHKGIAISVRDEGFGIPPQERREIFRKFVRGEKAGKLGIKGTGLGLALVTDIIEAHGGAIELESEEGKGSTFRLVLPAQA